MTEQDMRKRNILVIAIAAIVLFGICAVSSVNYIYRNYLPHYKIESNVSATQSITYETERVANNQMQEQEETTTQQGMEGEKETYEYYKVKYVGDRVESSEAIPAPPGYPEERVTKQPINEIIEYGTIKGHPTGYVMKVRRRETLPTERNLKLDVSIPKITYDKGNLNVFVNIKNFPDSVNFKQEMWGEAIEVYSKSESASAEIVGDAELVPGESVQLIYRFKNAQSFYPRDYLVGAAKASWNSWGTGPMRYYSKEPLTKFWKGTFNKP